MLRVSEVFRSVQAEGTHTGTPAAFIRLYGCGVQCPWCDTPYTWKHPVQSVTFAELVTAPAESPLVAEVAEDDLAAWVAAQGVRHVVLTGGEPLEQPLTPLLQRLPQIVQVETSGTVLPSRETLALIDWLTVSPKVAMPGGRRVRREMIDLAHEIKMPVGRTRDLAHLFDLLEAARPETPVWLQPLSLSPKATELCLRVAAREGWKVSLQHHKTAGMR